MMRAHERKFSIEIHGKASPLLFVCSSQRRRSTLQNLDARGGVNCHQDAIGAANVYFEGGGLVHDVTELFANLETKMFSA